MEVEVRTPHDDYPKEATDMVRERLMGLAGVSEGATHVKALIGKDRERHTVEIVATGWGRAVHRSDASADSLAKAVAEAVEQLERALRRRDDKHRDLQRKPHE
ncbi:MAG: HPF/RaiA family ribosome-associated protein [Planctomycetota bacterium]